MIQQHSTATKSRRMAASLSFSAALICLVVFGMQLSMLSRFKSLHYFDDFLTAPRYTVNFSDLLYTAPDADTTTNVQRNLKTTMSSDTTDTNSSSSSKYTFNGVPLEKKYGVIESHAHCIGETHDIDKFDKNKKIPKNWMYKSCQFQNLCYNTTDHSFVVFRSPQEQALARQLETNEFILASSMLNQSVSIGGINRKWFENIQRLKWAPKVIDTTTNSNMPQSYYSMKIPLILYHSLSAVNPGHLIWDDFLPMYTLMQLFQVQLPILPLRYILHDGKNPLWASCESSEERSQLCHKMTTKFKPLLLGTDYPYQYTSIDDINIQIPPPGQHNNNKDDDDLLICAETALVGIGDLTDHGTEKGHGWEIADYSTKHNHGRNFYDFRNFMISNLNLPIVPRKTKKVVFSIASSDDKGRSLTFGKEIKALKEIEGIDVQVATMKNLTLQEQVELVHDAAVYISMCGGGAVNAMLLPKGSSVIMYYFKAGGYEMGKFTQKPAPLDWDLMNSLSYLRVHWMPRETMHRDTDTLVSLVQHDLMMTNL